MNSNLADRVTPYTDIIDSRDVIELIEQLQSEITALVEERADLTFNESTLNEDEMSGYDKERVAEIDEELTDLQEQLDPLEALEVEGSSISSDWEYGETLIADSYFLEYAQQLADDIGAIDKNAGWPMQFVDWEAAADALKEDYFSCDFSGEVYWIRS